MAKVKEINLGRRHQEKAYRYARRILSSRRGGIVLADGVGLGKTYEALATVATVLSQRQHTKVHKKQQYQILVLVPPNLVTKWADETDKFCDYLRGWTSPATDPVAQAFRDVVVLRRQADLEAKPGKLRYGKVVLPKGFYIVNINLLGRAGQSYKKNTQIHKTQWDAIIVDEAHRTGNDLVRWAPHTLLANVNTPAILLTATPFQLSPTELKGLMEATFGGYGDPRQWGKAEKDAQEIYADTSFQAYRASMNRFFRTGDLEAAKEVARNRDAVSGLLRERIVRNQRKVNRRYFLVNEAGSTSEVRPGPFHLGDEALARVLKPCHLIDPGETAANIYMRVRDRLAESCAKGQRPFVAAALRQLMSTYEQFRFSEFGRAVRVELPSNGHPKLAALERLVAKLLARECTQAVKRGWMGKVLVFTTYVGAERSSDLPKMEGAHGTAAAIKDVLDKRLRPRFPRATRERRLLIRDTLMTVVERHGPRLHEGELQHLKDLKANLRTFAGSPAAATLLASHKRLMAEARTLARLLRAVDGVTVNAEGGANKGEEDERRAREHRRRAFQRVLDRYSTRDLVARYDGATPSEDRDRHLRGFNSPFGPLVLIASSIGQEGIDLQRYCSHVVHYDLEWNPARLEQREGRVDRQGREASGPVNVYFLLCRGTYDERILHVMVNRFRWHQVLLANKSVLAADPSRSREPEAPANLIRNLALDLRPRLVE